VHTQYDSERTSASWQEKGFENEIFVMLTPMALRRFAALMKLGGFRSEADMNRPA
jgi:hypothetical protein